MTLPEGYSDIEDVDVCKWGGFIDDVAAFDPLFFNISPAEASYIDPQHRLFLEESWRCLEDAGYSVEELAGKNIGVYAGVSKNDYTEIMREKEQMGSLRSFLPVQCTQFWQIGSLTFLISRARVRWWILRAPAFW